MRVLTLIPLLAAAACCRADWPQWRGPRSNAVTDAAHLPERLDLNDNLVWRVSLPGPGASTPIQAASNIVVSCEVDGQDALVAYDHDGHEKWRRSFGPGREGKHRNATGANSSPVTDGERVFAYFKSGRLVATSVTGDILWQRNLQEEFGEDTLWWDLGTSPILTPAGVLIAVMQADQSYVVTLDKADGQVVWKQDRTIERPKESDQSYTTPTLAETEHGPTVVIWGADYVTGHDPTSGAELFRCGGFNPDDKPMWRSIASATAVDDLLIVPFGRGDFLGAMRLGGDGDTTATHRLWTVQGVGADVTCPAVRDGLAYIQGDKGTLTCIRIDDGARVWTAKLPRSKDKYFASPLLAGDKLYSFREDGAGFVVRIAADGATVVDQCDLGETLVASPTPLGDDRLLVRTREALYCFGG